MIDAQKQCQTLRSLFIVLFVSIFFCLTKGAVHAQAPRHGDQPGKGHAKLAVTASHIGNSPFEPPKHNDTTFLVDSSAGLDTDCTFRSGGPLIFNLPIDRVLGDKHKLIANGLLSPLANLRMPAFDVDFNANILDISPERDRVFFNGHVVPGEFLQGQDETWILNDFNIPLDWINFPDDPGEGGVLTPKDNTIQIDIDTANATEEWCTAIDWATLSIQTARPILMVHGILSSGNTWNQAGYFQWSPALNDLGLLNATLDMGKLDSIGNNAGKIANRVNQLSKRWGIDRLNIVAHSKGGIDSRDYIATNPTVERLIQLGTPNAGSPLADAAQAGSVLLVGVVGTALLDGLATPAGIQLTTPYMNTYNLFHGSNPQTTYVALAGDYHFGGLGIIDAIVQGFYGEGNDTIVPVSSVHALSYATHLTHATTGNDTSAQHTSLTNAQSIYNQVLPFFKIIGQPTPALQAAALAARSTAPTVQASTIADVIAQGQTKSHSFFVDAAQPLNFMLQYGTGELHLVLISPTGIRIDPSSVASSTTIEFAAHHTGEGVPFEIYGLQNPTVGQWTLEVSGAAVVNPAGQEPYVLTAMFANSSLQMHAAVGQPAYHKGEPLTIQATLSNNNTALLGANVAAKIILPDQSFTLLPLVDDGTNGDLAAGDGIYAGRFQATTQAGLYRLLVSAAKAASPTFRRDQLLVTYVSTSTSDFTGAFSDFGSDTNGDGLFDKLVINVGVNVSAPSTYRVIGELADSNGVVITTAFTETTLNSGAQTLPLAFDSAPIFQHAVHGPYMLKLVRLAENDGTSVLPLAERQAAYTTAPYNYTQFRGSSIAVAGTGSDQGSDTDNNGLFNQLTINLDVIVSNAGDYQWSANLVDAKGHQLGVFANTGLLNAGSNTISFNFDGTAIGQNGVNGPYFLKDLLIFAGNESAVVFQAYTTSGYRASQFEGFVAPPPADLSLTMAAVPVSLLAGQHLTYTLTTLNNGPGNATDLVLTDTLPAGATVVSASATQGFCNLLSDTVICQLHDLATSASATVTLVATIDTKTFMAVSNEAHVSASSTDPNPANNLASASVNVTPMNAAPIAKDDSVSTDEDTPVTMPILSNDTDPNGDQLKVTLTTLPKQGSLVSQADGTLTYTPNANFHGTDTFIYTICDPNNACASATARITVLPVNDPPVAQNDAATTQEDTPVIIPVLNNDTDVDDDGLKLAAITQGSQGTVTTNADNTLTYTPKLHFYGADTFLYNVCDPSNSCVSAMVTVTVTPGLRTLYLPLLRR